jgi:hypothetical protein
MPFPLVDHAKIIAPGCQPNKTVVGRLCYKKSWFIAGIAHETGASEQINVQGVYKPGTLEPAKPASEEQAEPGETPQSAAQQRRERMTQEREERREAREETEQMCARHRSRLEQMEPARRVFVTNEDGESERLDDDQRMALINESKEFIAKNCE